jgi:DNA modification methylase
MSSANVANRVPSSEFSAQSIRDLGIARSVTKGFNNRLYPEDLAAHEWYRFVLAFPPHLVRDYISEFSLNSSSRILDPFCGTGTTLVESKKLGIGSVGFEPAPMAHFASSVKTDWSVDPKDLRAAARRVAKTTVKTLRQIGTPEVEQVTFGDSSDCGGGGLRTLPSAAASLLLAGSISAVPLHKVLTLLDAIDKEDTDMVRHLRLAVAQALVASIGNVAFGPEIGVTRPKADCPVVEPWLNVVERITLDLEFLRSLVPARSLALRADARTAIARVKPNSIDLVLTSPPYPNEKDYTRTTRLESVILGFLRDKQQLQRFKKTLLRSNTRNIYVGDNDAASIAHLPEIGRLSREIEARRLELKKTSGFERLYATVTKEYFGGMAKHLQQVKGLLKNNAHLVYIVGEQASFFQILIKTGHLLASVGESLGYEVRDIQLFRGRISTRTKQYLREEAVILQWRGDRKQVAINGLKQSELKLGLPIMKNQNRNIPMIEALFHDRYRPGDKEVVFVRDDLERIGKKLRINLPKNLWDVVYSFRHRVALPESIRNTAQEGYEWAIRPKGRGKYAFELAPETLLRPGANLAVTKVPDNTPGVVALYASNEKQSLLSRLRYNDLLTLFTSVLCYSIQNHFRTFVAGVGQLDTDELYVGIDKKGTHYVFPVQARTEKEKLNPMQIEQSFALCASKFPNLVCRPIGAQFASNDRIALFEFELEAGRVQIVSERHYQLAPVSEFTPELLRQYKQRLSQP